METYKGFVELKDCGDADDVLFLSEVSEPLCEALEYFSGKQISVKYYSSDIKKTKEEIQEKFMEQLVGLASIKYADMYSEYTGYLWTDESLNIGGHDLLGTLSDSYLGKYIILEITIEASPTKS